ncbi:MAG: hypothetical protein WCO94_00120 [Verrucomicrobiota bacterium]
MKILQTLVIAAVGLITANFASATTTIYIVGSNGDRGATLTGIANILTGDWYFRGNQGNASKVSGVSTNWTSTGAQGSNYGVFNGTYGGVNVVVKTSFIGAAGAVAAVAAHDQVNNPNATPRFTVSNGTDSVTVVDLYDPTVNAQQGTDYELHTANFGLSTNFQATTPYNGTFNGQVYDALTQETVGISPLIFIASAGFPAGKNLTTQLAQLLWSTGALPLSYFTGDWVNGDQNKIVYALGRNTDAGQRYGTYAEFGLGAQAVVNVFKPVITPSSQTTTNNIVSGGTVATHDRWPAENVGGVASPLGSGGFQTGANLAPFLTATLLPAAYKTTYLDPDLGQNVDTYPNATAGYYIGYLTPSDALSRVLDINSSGVVQNNISAGNRGVVLSWNGVSYDFAAGNNLKNGQYTAWLYNRLLKRIPDGLDATTSAFYTSLKSQISTSTATSGGGLKDDTSVKVKKTVDGGLVTSK